MINRIDQFLDGITMYKVMVYGLCILGIIAIFFGFFGILPYKGYQYTISLLFFFFGCWVINAIFAKLYNVPANSESSYITGLILFFILTPIQSIAMLPTYIFTILLSMVPKYVFAYHRRHIFNPAAATAVVLGLLGSPIVSWWVGSLMMLPFVTILGLLVLKKVQRFSMFFVFFVCALVTICFFGISQGVSLVKILSQVFTSWPIIFFGTIMLTEPLTTPPTNTRRLIYGGIVGVLFGSQFSIGQLYTTPELALVIGNVFSYMISSKEKLLLQLNERKQIAQDMYELVFIPRGNFLYTAGQYMEWTLAHKGTDSRGNRRYFTVASSPTENTFKLGIKFVEKGSSFKSQLLSMPIRSTILAGQVAGDFTLPKDKTKKLVFLGGGIGITPFRSMIKYLIDSNEKRNIVLFYSNKDASEIVYKEVFDDAEKKLGIKIIYTLTDTEHIDKNWTGEKGRVDQQMIEKYVPDYKSRTYYISGPHAMVMGYETLLKSLGISSSQIVIDYFPGFV